MALTDQAAIQAAILHSEPAIRERAVGYFAEAHSTDPRVMPRVVEAVEQYGLQHAWRLLLTARPLRQTPETLEWVIQQLQRPFDHDDVDQDNQHHALAWLLVEAEPSLLSERYERIIKEIELPNQLREVLDERLMLWRSDWAHCWAKFESLGQDVIEADQWTIDHLQRCGRIVEALAGHGRGQRERENFVLNLARRQFPKAKRELFETIEPRILDLAGRMQLTQAVPLLLRRLEEEDEADLFATADAAIQALQRIGGNEVAQPLAQAWWQAEPDARSAMADVLGCIRTELAAERCMAFLQREEDETVLQMLALSAMKQLNPAAIEPVVQLVADETLLEDDPEWQSVRVMLVEAAMITGVRFTEYEQWYEQVRNAPWGWRWAPPKYRISEGPAGMMKAMEDESDVIDEPDLMWRLKVALEGVEPPVWRRVELPDVPLDELHMILQNAFGWEDAHRYAFRVNDVEYGDPWVANGDGPTTRDATDTWLSDVVTGEGDRLDYIYDFGDHWQHQITVERVWETDDPFVPPVCLAGESACPPEDVGGPPGYAAYLEALADPDHERHREMLDWNGPFDPKTFDCDAVNANLRRGFDQWEAQMNCEMDEVLGDFDYETMAPDLFNDSLAGLIADEFEDLLPLPADDDAARFPLGTVAMYGPDDKTATKIVASVFAYPNAEPILKRWVGTDVAESEKVQSQITAFFEQHNARYVVATSGNIGCPHEEGQDFPEGEDCPFCPAWRGKQ